MQNSWKPIKINIPKTKSEWVWDIIGYSLFIGNITLLITIWGRLPSQIPAHFNIAGEVDRWGSKWELLLIPFFSIFILLFLQILEKFPEVHNYPKRINESNAKEFYLVSRKLMNQLKNICLIIFSLISFESIAIALEWDIQFGIWLLPAGLILAFIPIIVSLVKQKKIQ